MRVLGEWAQEALCAQVDPDTWFPDKGGTTKPAKQVCRGCSVRRACLQYAIENDLQFGVFGGLSGRERRKLHYAFNGGRITLADVL